jgi:hypothetical protein
MYKFKVNQQLSARSTCDHDCIFKATVVKRTAKTVTITTSSDDEKRCKIHLDGENEYIFPYGRYSMAAIFRARPLFNE